MAIEIKDRQCQNCGETYRPNSRKNTHYCSTQCGDHFRNNRKREKRLSRAKNKSILDSYQLVRGNRIYVTQKELEGKGFKGELFDSIEYFPIPNSTAKSSIIYYGQYTLCNESGKLLLTKF
jgi:hypothetical protein